MMTSTDPQSPTAAPFSPPSTAAPAADPPRPDKVWPAEWPLLPALVTSVAVLASGTGWIGEAGTPMLAAVFAWLFITILTSALRVVHHAECLAGLFGEPYGTLILTLAVTGIEVMMMTALILHGENNPTLARDSMFAVVMIVLNGLVGLALILGALRYREQSYNLQGARAYLSVIMPLTVLTLVMPDLTVSTPEPTLSATQAAFVLVASLALYSVFLLIQTRRHSTYFIEDAYGHEEPQVQPHKAAREGTPEGVDGAASGETQGGQDRHATPGSPYRHAAFLIGYLALVVILAEALAIPLDLGIEVAALPPALGGLVIAILVLSPESLGALRAARRNRLQRAVNISLGSVLATIGLTGPAVLAIGLVTGNPVTLGIDAAETALLVLTLAVSMLTFSGNRTNLLQGAVHLILFLMYLMLIFAP